MNIIRLISLISRAALMITLVLGVVFWIAELVVWAGGLLFLAQIGFPGTHELFGIIGVFGLFLLGGGAVFTRGSRLLGAASLIYALLVPAFGLTQTLLLVGSLHWLIQAAHLLLGIGAMVVIQRVEQHILRLKRNEHEGRRERWLRGTA